MMESKTSQKLGPTEKNEGPGYGQYVGKYKRFSYLMHISF